VAAGCDVLLTSGQRSKILAVLVGCWLMADCVAALAAPAPPRSELVYVIGNGWHTEVALPKSAISGPLSRLAGEYPTASFMIFGWGARDFYMARNPGLGDLLRAAVPGPAVMLVTPLGVPPTAYLGPGNVWTLPISRSGAVRLSQFLWDSLAKAGNGALSRAGAGPYPQSVFYAARGTYDAADTCNTWTAEALRAAGLPVTVAGVVFESQLTDQLPALTAVATRIGERR
jgi:uncharacterized protein (TIGR02117 family)